MDSMKKHPEIFFDLQTSVKINKAQEKKLQQWLVLAGLVMKKVIKDPQFVDQKWLSSIQSVRISVLLCGEVKIKKLNSEHRQKNKVTDVLSFPSFISLRKTPSQGEFVREELFLGDLAICHQKVISQAEEFNISYFDEFIHLLFHGVIHLVGYDHEISLKEEKIMEDWEEKMLQLFSKAKKKGA